MSTKSAQCPEWWTDNIACYISKLELRYKSLPTNTIPTTSYQSVNPTTNQTGSEPINFLIAYLVDTEKCANTDLQTITTKAETGNKKESILASAPLATSSDFTAFC